MVMSMNSMGMGNGGNVYQAVKAKYACGYADMADRPKTAGYPMDAIPKAPEPPIKDSGVGRILKLLYA